MSETNKYHIYYPDTDQAGYQQMADVPENDRLQAESIDTALALIDLRETVGDLEELETAITSSIVAAINGLNSNIGDLNNLETTVKSSIVAAINELKGDEANVGSLGDLETTVKTSIVAAINEINGKADDIGDLTNLETTIKTSIVAAINELKGNITTLQNNDATFATAINMKISNTEKGSNNGIAQLDSNGKVPSSQLPSYVDDIIEGYYYEGKFYTDSAHTTEITGEEGKIYVDLVTNKTYRWSSTIFVEISESLALGETSSTAYRGDKGKEAYDRGIQNKKDIDELGNILYTKKELTSINNQVSFTGNENLEFSITEIDGKTEQNSTNGYQLLDRSKGRDTFVYQRGNNYL